MLDLRPVVYVIGRVLSALGVLMLLPALVDRADPGGNGAAFLKAALFTTGIGVLLVLATRNALRGGVGVRQAFLLTVGIWTCVPLFGALPFMFGAPGLNLTDAYFEAVSGITTTGSTVIVGLDGLPAGANLWRGMLNWLGGLGIAFVAMIFLPVMRVGGMQFFRTEGFDTLGKTLPRATDIAKGLLGVYAGLTLACILTYLAIGMTGLDAVVKGAATIATGGFSPADSSFTKYRGAAEYAGALFMMLGALPYVRYVQLVNGQARPLWRDPQVWAFLRWIAYAVSAVTLWRLVTAGAPVEPVLRETLFNLVSIMTGTGFFSGDFGNWGTFALVVAFVVGMIGGCTSSSSGALSVFRVQVLLAAIASQIRLIQTPHRIAPVRYDGRVVEEDTLNALIHYVSSYVLVLGVLSVAMTLVGVDLTSSVFGIWSSIGNIGYGIGPMVAPTGTYRDFPDAAKWVMILAMLMGRLALLAFFVIVMPRFWMR